MEVDEIQENDQQVYFKNFFFCFLFGTGKFFAVSFLFWVDKAAVVIKQFWNVIPKCNV